MLSFGPISLTAISALWKWLPQPTAAAARLVTPPFQDRFVTVIPIQRSGAVTSYGVVQSDPWLKV